MMEICRLCNKSRHKKDLTSIDDTRDIVKKLREAFNIELTVSQNPIYNFCCRFCISKLDTSHEFYHQVIESQKKFEGINFDPLITIIKTETEDTEIMDCNDSDNTCNDDDDDADDDGDDDYCGDSVKASTSRLKNVQSSAKEQSVTDIKDDTLFFSSNKKRKYFDTFDSGYFTLKNIYFTAEEINDCSVIENGQIRFLQKRYANTEGKTPYIHYVCQKLTEASATKTKFKVTEGFKASGKKNKVCYVFCAHRRKMPVSYVGFQHQMGSPLTMKWKVDCPHCNGQILNDTEEVKGETSEKITYEPKPTDDFEFMKAMRILSGSLNTVLLGIEHKCLSNPNPLDVLFNDVAEFGIIANSAIVETILALRNSKK